MTVMDFVSYVTAHVSGLTFYANEFPASGVDDIGFVRLTGGGSPTRSIVRPSIQVVLRMADPATAEGKANEIMALFNVVAGLTVGGTTVVYSESQTSTPLYLGLDENNRTMYSLNFNLITE